MAPPKMSRMKEKCCDITGTMWIWRNQEILNTHWIFASFDIAFLLPRRWGITAAVAVWRSGHGSTGGLLEHLDAQWQVSFLFFTPFFT